MWVFDTGRSSERNTAKNRPTHTAVRGLWWRCARRILCSAGVDTTMPVATNDRWRAGVVAAELAFAVPIMVLLIGAIIQFGMLFFLQNMMTDAARISVRALALSEMTVAEAEQAALDRLAGWQMTFSVDAQEPDPSDPTDRDVTVDISVPLSQATVVDVLGLFGVGDLSTTVTMRRES